MRVLVAEDHERLARAVAAGLRRYGMIVDVALDGDDALARLGASRYDVVVLDRDLPGTHGDEICRTLAAERSKSRVLMLTAASSVKDRVEGLGPAADDYLPKPFDFTELVARVQALGRRPGAAKPEHLGYRDLTVDPEKGLADRAGRRLALSPKEFAVLEYLLAAEGRPVSAEELLERVWDQATDPFTTTVKATVTRLRLTALVGGLFLVTGTALAAVTYALFERATEYRTPSLPRIPRTPTIKNLQLPAPLGQAFYRLSQFQNQLAQTQHQMAGLAVGPLARQDQQLTQAQQQLIRDQHQLALSVRQLAQSVHQLAQTGTVQAAQRATDAHQLLVNSGIALGIVAVLALLAGWLVAGWMLRPIRTITRTARRISSTSLHERLALDGPQDELKELGDTLDDLFARLEAAFEAQRHFVANASHELRTPLTAERTLLQVALDDPGTTTTAWRCTAEEVLASSDEQARLIEAMLTLASSESGLNDHQPIDLATTVSSTLTGLESEITRLEIRIDEATAPAL